MTIGLPGPKTPSRREVATFKRAIDSLFARTIPRDLLVDRDTSKLRAMIDKKKRGLVRMSSASSTHPTAAIRMKKSKSIYSIRSGKVASRNQV